MTRTWFRVRDWPIFAWAGFCRRTEEWGPVYAAMTTDSSPAVAALNPRIPVILAPQEYERWLEGSIQDVIAFQFRPPFPSERLLVDRTDELWVPRNRRREAAMRSSLGARHSSGASSSQASAPPRGKALFSMDSWQANAMCNLTTVRKSAAEVARHFGVRTPPDVALNVPEETLPGYPGMAMRSRRRARPGMHGVGLLPQENEK
jgi:hypothetical protein